VKSVAISQDNKFIVSGSEDKTIRIWDRESGLQLQVLKGHIKKVSGVAIS
jgi:WD40 repeat protein